MATKAFKISAIAMAFAFCVSANAQDSVSRILQAAKPVAAGAEELSVVRESALREAAVLLGARQGLQDKSCSIRREITARSSRLDERFRFSNLMMGAGVLPPVISKARDTVSLGDVVMRIATVAYVIHEPARLVDIPPTWRDWLFVGLSAANCGASAIDSIPEQIKPRNPTEQAYFERVVKSSYQLGVSQAEAIHEQNMARITRAHKGMQNYYDLYAAGLVTAPRIVTTTDIVTRDDPNTLIVGDTLIRITVPVDFVEKHETWKPLAE